MSYFDLSVRASMRSRATDMPTAARGRLSKWRGLSFESLELRTVLSAAATVDLSELLAAPSIESLAAVTNTTPRGYTPSQIAAAYGYSGITFNSGTVTGNGSGQTIAIIDAYNDPNVVSDLHVFDQTFGLADPASFKVVNQSGGSALPRTDSGWSEEIALDVEWAHAMAPGANIMLVEANSSSISDLMAAVNYARNAAGVSVVSMSWGSSEFLSETQYDAYFTTPAGHTGVTFVASSGDSGAGASWPAVSPNVLSVGGTSLSTVAGAYSSETAWSGSGGGYSSYETEPSFQRSLQSSGVRTSPDVSYDANPSTGFAVYDTVTTGGQTGWFEIGGTSAGAPQWASLVAIADQGRALSGQGTLSGAQTTIAALSSADFHDVTVGSNGYSAHAGYDLVTGRGSPIVGSVVRDLVNNATVSSTPTQPTSGSTTQTSRITYEWIYWHHHWWLIQITTPGVARAASDGGSIDDQMDSIEAAVANTQTIAAPTTTAANSLVGNANSGPPSAGVNGDLTSRLLVIAGGSTSGAGGVVTTDAPRAADQRDAEGSDSESGDAPLPSQGDGDAPAESTPAAAATARSNIITRDGAEPGALDAIRQSCFGESQWMTELEDAVGGLSEVAGGSREWNLATLAAAVAVGVNCTKRDRAETESTGPRTLAVRRARRS